MRIAYPTCKAGLLKPSISTSPDRGIKHNRNETTQILAIKEPNSEIALNRSFFDFHFNILLVI